MNPDGDISSVRVCYIKNIDISSAFCIWRIRAWAYMEVRYYDILCMLRKGGEKLVEEYKMLVSIRKTTEELIRYYYSPDIWPEVMNTSKTLVIEANSIGEAKEKFMASDVYDEFTRKNDTFWFYHEEDGKLVLG